MDLKNGCANKTIPNIYFERHTLVVGALEHAKREKMSKIKVKNTKSPILRPTFPFRHFWGALGAHTSHLHLTKYIFGIFLFAKPVFGPFMESIMFQMENWPQNP